LVKKNKGMITLVLWI